MPKSSTPGSSVVFAFLPIGSKSTASHHYIRLGHCSIRTSTGNPVNVANRFHGLNSVREMLLLVAVERHDAGKMLDDLKNELRGPGLINTVPITMFRTFTTSALGQNWMETDLPLADVRAVMYETAERLGGQKNAASSDLENRPLQRFPKISDHNLADFAKATAALSLSGAGLGTKT
jgi:hypothetical protein